MANKNVEEKVSESIENEIAKLGYDLYDVEYLKEGSDFYLRVFIDSEKGIAIEDCEKVSNIIDPILDKADFIQEQYFLEVSSTGVERSLRKDTHYLNAIGKKIKLKLYEKIDNKKTLVGILKKYNAQEIKNKNGENNGKTTIKIEVDGKILEIDCKNIASAKIVYDWN